MKNPHITTKLNRMMAEEKQTRIQLIEAIINHKLTLDPQLAIEAEFDYLYDLHINDLNAILGDIISDIEAMINRHIQMVLNSNKHG